MLTPLQSTEGGNTPQVLNSIKDVYCKTEDLIEKFVRLFIKFLNWREYK